MDAPPRVPVAQVVGRESRQMRRAGATLELVNETVDQDLNLDALHDALAGLLVRYHAARGAQTTPTG